MRDGLLVYFGDDARPHAKWLALARVLADPSSDGSRYVDVRLPERPAAGTQTAPSKPVGQSRASEEASLAGALDRAVGGEAQTVPQATTTPATPETTTGATSETTPPATPETSTGATSETSTGATSETAAGATSETPSPATSVATMPATPETSTPGTPEATPGG